MPLWAPMGLFNPEAPRLFGRCASSWLTSCGSSVMVSLLL